MDDALAIRAASRAHHVPVLVNYETTWYASNAEALQLADAGKLGEVRKAVVHDGHEGPAEIGVGPEWLPWLTDPVRNGAGALFDFGCYGADLLTVLMHGAAPLSVTAASQTDKPALYPNVEDDATVILRYPKMQAVLMPSWTWSFARKDMELYGVGGTATTVGPSKLRTRFKGQSEETLASSPALPDSRSNSLGYLAAVLHGDIKPDGDLSSLDTNMVVMQILDAARTSAKTGRTVTLTALSTMRRTILRAAVFFLLVAPVSLAAQQERRMQQRGDGPGGAPETVFLAHRLGTDHAEGITTLDINGDGFLDLVSGAYWYENPGANGGDWKQHQWRTVGIHEEFVSDCGEWTVDVNHDGAPDIVTAGWITNGMWWYENPKKAGVLWQKHLIVDSFDTEGGAFADINGDGKPDLILAHYNHSGLVWADFSGATPRVHHLQPKETDGHGVGIADIDGDGRADILTPTGWFKNVDADTDKWEWHPDWQLGDAGFPILGYDVNNDGRLDLIVGQGHGYGLYWWEQTGPREHPAWTRHAIDESFSQSHALRLVDIDGDGQPELITGKRYRGHSGNDPGSYDPVVLFAYKIDRRTGHVYTDHDLDEWHGERRHTDCRRRPRSRRRRRSRHRRQTWRAFSREPSREPSAKGNTGSAAALGAPMAVSERGHASQAGEWPRGSEGQPALSAGLPAVTL